MGLAFLLLLLCYHKIFGSYFPLPNGLIGHDYSLALPAFLDGFLWFRNNGFLTPPWFTPSFCAGQPYFADPQSAFYSAPQFLAFVTDPLKAVYVSLLLFASLGFWGTYLLGRRAFGLGAWSATAASTIFMFNGFYAHRMIVGHVTYQPYMLVPAVAWLLIGTGKSDGDHRSRTVLSVLVGGWLIAYWLQAGLTTLMVPAGLAVVALGCLASFRDPTALGRLAARGAGATIIALCLSAAKLSASLSLMSHFPRDYYPLPGISDVGGLFKLIFQTLFYSSEHAYRTATPLWKNMQWAAMPHELAYGVTLIPLIVLLVGGVLYFRGPLNAKPAESAPSPRWPWSSTLLLCGILILPLALLYYSPEWNAILKRLPLVGSTTSPFRWLIIYIPILAILSGLAADVSPLFSKIAALLCVVGIPAVNAFENRDFYQQQSYDPTPVLAYDRAIRSGNVQPAIRTIELPRSPTGQIVGDNTLFTQGASPLVCYNPLFGYRLEKYDIGSLAPGDVFSKTDSNHLNFRNPACLVFPRENQCAKPWEGFRTGEADRLRNFVNYRPFEFKQGAMQRIADRITELSLVGYLAALIGLLVARILPRHSAGDA